MKLYQFIAIFGGLLLLLAQIPSFHSLRHINLISLVLCLAYSACVTAGAINIGTYDLNPRFHACMHARHIFVYVRIAHKIPVHTSLITGHSDNAPIRDYSVNGTGVNRVFSAANAVAIISTTYACGIIPEIQVRTYYFLDFISHIFNDKLYIKFHILVKYWSSGLLSKV